MTSLHSGPMDSERPAPRLPEPPVLASLEPGDLPGSALPEAPDAQRSGAEAVRPDIETATSDVDGG
jgi:hypothetical protein